MKNNTLGDDIPCVLILKAMGMESDQEIVQLVGDEKEIVDQMALSLEDLNKLGIRTQEQGEENGVEEMTTRDCEF